MNVAQPHPRDLEAQRVAHQGLRKGVATTPGVPGLHEQAGGHPLVQRLCHLFLRSANVLRQKLDVDLGAEDGGHRQHVPGAFRHVGEAAAENVAHAGGNRPAADVCVTWFDDRGQLDRVEGVASGALPQAVGEALGALGAAGRSRTRSASSPSLSGPSTMRSATAREATVPRRSRSGA